MKKTILLALLAFFCGFAAFSQTIKTKETRLSLDNGWRFHPGDIPFPEIKGHGASYSNAKAGKASGAAASDFDDTDWRLLNLPHDWASEAPFDEKANLSQGFRPRGMSWYRRSFKLDKNDRGKYLEIQFDGVSSHCTVWFNGIAVHRNWSGYTSFYIDISAMAKYGDELNSVAIQVNAVDQEGWWYEGAGIYRHTWLVKNNPVHVITDGIFAQPVLDKKNQWLIPVEAMLENSSKTAASALVDVTLFDPQGKKLTTGSTSAMLQPLQQNTAKLSLKVDKPKLWSVDEPKLYTVQTIIKNNGQPVDTVFTQCGFRSIKFTADSGFYLNGKPLKLQGVCNHQDHAGVGVAVPNSLWEFRIRKLKEMGVNAYRCAHNPPAREFLEACDRMGMLVMDENRNFNASPEYIRQLNWLVQRDRNHPSVILWSVFNEEPMQGTESGYEMVRRMREAVLQMDTTRPVTAAMNGGLFEPINVSQAVDVVGFNYQIESYDRFHKANPKIPLTSSEDASAFMTRGEYITDKGKQILDSYDTQRADWGATHRDAWKAVAERPYLAGCFVWTGFDYHGEPTPFGWPSAGSFFGIMDQCGFPKTAFYIHQAQWVKNRPILQLAPHWNWSGKEGQPVKVMAMSNAEKVKLILNGKIIGEKPVDKYEMVSWEVPYQPGKLEAFGYVNGKQVSHFVVETTGKAVTLRLTPDRNKIAADGWDAIPVTVEALDAKDRPVPLAQNRIDFTIGKTGSIIGLGNGDPNSHEAEKGHERSLFNGLAQVIIQSKAASAGFVKLSATSPGLKPATIKIALEKTEPIAAVGVIKPYLVLDKWLLSPHTSTKPNPNQKIAEGDMNSWQPTRPGEFQDFSGDTFGVFRTRFKAYAGQQKKGAKISLQKLGGKAEVWLDGKLVHTKSGFGEQDILINLPPAQIEHTLSVLIETEKDKKAGLGGLVSVQSID